MTPRLGLAIRNMASGPLAAVAAAAEAAGFTDLLLPETGHAGPSCAVTGRDPFVGAAAALRATSTLRAGPGVAATTVRPARLMAVAAATVQEESGGRFLLGCGVTHRGAVEALGLAYPGSPLQHAREYLDELRRFSSDALAFGTGFPVLLGALGDRMVAVAAEHADGVILNWLTERAITRLTAAYEAASAGPARAGVMLLMRAGPRDALLREASFYDSLPNYRAHFVRQGLGSAQDAVQETCMPADGGVVAERLLRARAVGVTVPCLYPSPLSPDEICSLVADVGVHMAAATN